MKTKSIIATGAVVIVGTVGALTLAPDKTLEEISIEAQIEQLEELMIEKEARGEGTTITLQKIQELKLQLN